VAAAGALLRVPARGFLALALTDVGTLAPVALALLCSVRIAETAPGAGARGPVWRAGLAIGFKYTAGTRAAGARRWRC
jgi:hypothetical protein